jgi:glycosyltransferase involved in cell wall biosynthesis
MSIVDQISDHTPDVVSHTPLVSIVTPSYNQGQFLEATLCSVLEQDYPRLEYIVMDGGSTDGSPQILERYASRLAYWESQPDRGQAHAINKGLQHAHGDILGWLNSDDVLLPGVVSQVVQVFAQNPRVDVVYGRLERIDANGRLWHTPLLPKDRMEFDLSQVLGECVVNQPGSFWRRGIMEQVGLLDEKLHYSLDYEYWIRMALSGARFMRLPTVVARFRLSSDSKTVGRTAVFAQEQLQVLETLAARPDLPNLLGWTTSQVYHQAQMTRARIRLNVGYGYLKLHNWKKAAYWLFTALRANPLVLFERRWFVLAFARLRNQWKRHMHSTG